MNCLLCGAHPTVLTLKELWVLLLIITLVDYLLHSRNDWYVTFEKRDPDIIWLLLPFDLP